jgi:uncharacterized peroxidase-related enzyme
MTRLPLQSLPPPDLVALYEEIVAAGFGAERPLNFFTALAVRPDILDATWDLTRTVLVDGRLPNAVKQMIALSVSHQNACRYCSVVHRGALESAGVDPRIIDSCTSDPDTRLLAEPHRGIVQFALKAAREPDAVDDEDFQRLRDHGLADEEIIEILMMAGFTTFINTWADISGIPLDSET